MQMSLPSLSINRPVFAWMLTLAILIAGVLSLRRLGVSLYPDIDFPIVSVSVGYPGSAPELIETDITEILEGALSGVEGVQAINSESRFGSSRVSLEFNLKKNIDIAVQEVNSAVQGVLQRLPRDAETPVVSKSNPDDSPILWLALRADVPVRDLMYFAQTSIRDRLSTIEGVAEVSLGGFVDPQIRVWLDLHKLNTFELTYQDIVNSIKTEHREIPAGRITREKDEVNVRFMGEAPTVEELADLPVVRRGGQPIYRRIVLKDLGSTEKGLADVRRFTRADGKLAIGLGIRKQPGANSVAVAKAVKSKIKELSLPEGYSFSVNFDATREIEHSVRELNITLILSGLLTALVCWLFLGSLAATFNIALAIPVSLLGSFIVFDMLGYTLNSFTMLALILSIGIVVDDAIVVLENIFRVRKTEPNSKIAAQRGAEQVQLAAIATTLSLISIFSPIIFVEGMLGAYFAVFAIALSIAVLWSTLEALTFTPMRMANFRQGGKIPDFIQKIDVFVDQLSERYRNLVAKLFQSRGRGTWVYPVAIIVFVSSLFLIRFLPRELAPKEDTGTLMARVELPQGTSLDETGRRIKPLEEIFGNHPDIERSYTTVGGFGGSGSVNSGAIFVTLKPKNERKDHRHQEEIIQDLRALMKEKLKPDMRVFLQGRGGVSLSGNRRGFDIDLKLKGASWKDLVSGAKAFEKALKEEKIFEDVNSSYKDGLPELAVYPDRTRALRSWVSVEDISETLSFMFNGLPAAKFSDDGRRVDIVVQADPKTAPKDRDSFKNVYIRNSRSELVPITELVTFKDQSAPISIGRENRERSITVSANLAKGSFLNQGVEKSEEIAAKVLPEGVRLDRSGTAGDVDKSIASLLFAFVFGILAAYMVLASQFNSYLQPAIILLSLPFSLTGAFLTMLLSGGSLNIYSMIGLILLMGIVTKNGILLVEFANQGVESGLSVKDAVLDACRTRLRPILMTALTTMASAIIPAFKIGIQSESSAAMAKVVLGGMVLSTVVTLFLVPLAYYHSVKKHGAHD
jgi:hydrophobe/amphiphile efflux-1 (HAE1) family protein